MTLDSTFVHTCDRERALP